MVEFIGGTLAALVAVLIWEFGIKPSRDKRSLAAALEREIVLNLEGSVKDDTATASRGMPRITRFSTVVYEGNVHRLSELDDRAAELVKFYGTLFRLRSVCAAHAEAQRERTILDGHRERVGGLDEEIAGLRKEWEAGFGTLNGLLIELLPYLEEEAVGWRRRRQLRRRPPADRVARPLQLFTEASKEWAQEKPNEGSC